jgi:POT family proton-dependent oligopeptide transporter
MAAQFNTPPTPPSIDGAGSSERDRFPRGIPYIVGNEGAERFSFYGMRAILKIYLIALFVRFVDQATVSPEAMAEANARSTEVVHLFIAGVYAFPLLGAIISDRLLGKYRTILWVSLIYCAGHAVLAVAGRFGAIEQFNAAELSMYLGLSLIAIGSGGIKPCVSANVGDQFTLANSHLVSRVFQIFYFIINYGSFFSTVLTPLLLRYFGPEVAFGVPGVLMGIATIVFWMGRDKFVHVPPRPGGRLGLFDTLVTTLLFTPLFSIIVGYFVLWEHYLATAQEAAKAAGSEFPGVTGALVADYFAHYWWLPVGTVVAVALGFFLFRVRQGIDPDNGFLPVLLYNMTHQHERREGMSYFDVGRAKFGEEAGDGPPAVLKVMVVFSMVSVFWALFDQHASTWIDQARLMALGVSVPAYLGYWALAATLGLSLFAGIWLFRWIGNAPLPRSATVTVVGAVIALGIMAGVCDLVAPPLGNLVSDSAGESVRQRLLSIQMDAAQLSAFNPLFVMIVIPALNVLVYAPLRAAGIEVKPLQKMTVGMFLAAAAFVAAALLQEAIQTAATGSVHALWQIVQYFIMTVAEVLVSVTGLEFAYTQAPRAMKSTIMSFWLLCVTLGNLLVAFLAPLQKTLALSQFFWLFAALMAGAATVFLFLALLYKGKTYLQHAQED